MLDSKIFHANIQSCSSNRHQLLPPSAHAMHHSDKLNKISEGTKPQKLRECLPHNLSSTVVDHQRAAVGKNKCA